MEQDEEKRAPGDEIDVLPPEIRKEYDEIKRYHHKLLKRLAQGWFFHVVFVRLYPWRALLCVDLSSVAGTYPQASTLH